MALVRTYQLGLVTFFKTASLTAASPACSSAWMASIWSIHGSSSRCRMLRKRDWDWALGYLVK